jgi:hypothetical protein
MQLLPGTINRLSDNNFTLVSKRYRVDELLIRWHNLPKDSEVTIYFSDIDTRVIRALAALRRSPLPCEILDQKTLRFTVAGATWIPLPGDRQLNIPALLSVKLPPGVVSGEEFRVSLHQVDGRLGRIIGACEFRIVVSKAELILAEEIRTLSVFKHIATTIPVDNRWYPLILRYVHHLGVKVDALGGDANGVHPNPNGSGRPYEPTAQESCFDICRMLECLLRSKGIQELLRKFGIYPEELRECLKESCGNCGPHSPTKSPLLLRDRLRTLLSDEKMFRAVMQEVEKEKDQA